MEKTTFSGTAYLLENNLSFSKKLGRQHKLKNITENKIIKSPRKEINILPLLI